MLERRYQLARGLLGDPQPASNLGCGGSVRAHGLADEAVHRAGIGVADRRQPSVQFVDQRAEAQEQQEGELEARAG